MAHGNRPIEHNYQPEEELALLAADFHAHDFNSCSSHVNIGRGTNEVSGYELGDEVVAVDERSSPEDLLNMGIISLAEFEIIMHGVAGQIEIKRVPQSSRGAGNVDKGKQIAGLSQRLDVGFDDFKRAGVNPDKVPTHPNLN
jgi:hypothetical protein